jgi:hypothetical protein
MTPGLRSLTVVSAKVANRCSTAMPAGVQTKLCRIWGPILGRRLQAILDDSIEPSA